MFRTLHKVMIVGIVVFWVGLAATIASLVYQQRAAFYPVADGIEALKAWMTTDVRVAGEVSGMVTKVDDDYAFQMKDGQGLRYQFRLTGLVVPNYSVPPTKAELAWKKNVRTNLSQLILSNNVRVVATYLNEQRNGMGVTFVGDTNINALLVEQGLAKIKTEYLKGLPLKPYYAFLRAQRRAQQRQVGLWSCGTSDMPTSMTLASPAAPRP